MPHFLDLPRGSRLKDGLPIISGWFATDQNVNLADIRLNVRDGGQLPFSPERRPDVEALFPGHKVLGFTTVLKRDYWGCQELQLELSLDGSILDTMPVFIEPRAAAAIEQAIEGKTRKREWVLQHARCPACFSRSLATSDQDIRCSRCGTLYIQNTSALDLMTADAYRACTPERAAATSANPYDDTARALIAEVRDRGGMALDCGAGLRPEPNEAVINVEIGSYPSTDVLAIGENLPFQDCVFDAVLSITVLEHVSDPFRCARELVRVLKPGGRLYVVVPFLQPLHGYPHHYFNISAEGLRGLFPDLQVENHSVPRHGLPIRGLHWIVQLYAAHLPPEPRAQFLAMTMADLLAKPASEQLDDVIVSAMAESGRWELASETALILSK